MSTLLCLNKKSRSGNVDPARYVEKLRTLGPVEVHYLEDGSEPLSTVAARLGDALERIVVGGGDGTLNYVMPDLIELGLPLGVLPLGTANDFARSLGLPLEPDGALEVVVGKRTRKIDIGEANGRPFLNAAGIGLGPKLTATMDGEQKQKFGVLAYLMSFLQVVRQRWRRRAILELDDKRVKTRFMQITIVNGIHYGGGMTIAQDANVHDGQLRVLCLPPQSAWSLIGKALTLRWGVPRDNDSPEGMKFFVARRVNVKTRHSFEVTLDGELASETPLECRVLRDALDVYHDPQSLDKK